MVNKKTRLIDSRTREKIVEQSLLEIDFDRKYKEARIEDWHRNEKLLAHVKTKLGDQRANVGIANTKTISFVQTLLSKVDAPPNIKFSKATEADLKVAKRYNGLFQQDMNPQAQNLPFKDLIGKKNAIVSGRVVYDYHASSHKGYESHLNLVNHYDFLIDPSAGGLDIERARHLGRAGIWKSKHEIQKQIKKGFYIKAEAEKLITGKGQGDAATKDQEDKEEATFFLTGERKRFIEQADNYHFYEWYTTFEGERYFLLINEDSGIAIRVVKLKDLFESELYPFWTWATDPDDLEFWTLSPLDNVREIYITQGININQALDNNERINHPVIGVVAGAVKNLSDLRYGRDKRVMFKKGTDMRTATKTFETPQIDNPLAIYDTLESIGNLEGGVNADMKGSSGEDKVGIYEGNQAAISDRLGLLNRSYADGYQRFAKLYKNGVKEHLTKKTAIEMIGANGVEYEEVTGKEMKASRDLKVIIEASDAEMQADNQDKRNKIAFLASKAGDPTVNQKVRFEMEAEIAGMKKEDIDRLMDVDNFADAELMSEAAGEIVELISGNKVEPNYRANTRYAQKFVDYMKDQKNNLNTEQWKALEDYLLSVKEIIVANSVQAAIDVKGQIDQEKINAARGLGNPQVNNVTGTDPDIINNNN